MNYTSVQPPPEGVVPYGSGYLEGDQLNTAAQPPAYREDEGSSIDYTLIMQGDGILNICLV